MSNPLFNNAEKPLEINDIPKKISREKLVQKGRLVLTKKLNLGTNIRLKTTALIGRFKKIELPHTKEHLPEKEEILFKENIDIDSLPVGGIIEIWSQTPGTKEYQVTEYIRLK